MGDITDMILDGTLCQETGEYIDGSAPGYPRSAYEDTKEEKEYREYVEQHCVAVEQWLPAGKGKKRHKAFRCQMCMKRFNSEIGVRDHARDAHDRTVMEIKQVTQFSDE